MQAILEAVRAESLRMTVGEAVRRVTAFHCEHDMLERMAGHGYCPTLRVKDEHGKPATASFEIRDRRGRVYPSQAKRLAPDFAFHPQVYRADGESIRLPEGEYTIEFNRIHKGTNVFS